MALPDGLDGEGHAHRAVARKGDLGRLGGRPAGMLEERGDADAAPPAGPLGAPAALAKAGIVGLSQGLIENGREGAAVEGGADRGAIGHHRGCDHVAPAQLDGVDAGDARRLLDEALHHVVRLGPPGAAIGADR